MLYRNSVSPSKTAYCRDLENDAINEYFTSLEEDVKNECLIVQGIFSLSYEKKDSIMFEEVEEKEINAPMSSFNDLNSCELSFYQKNILYYIMGSAANKFLEKFPCNFCEAIILI